MFRLESPYKPTGDQPEAIKALVEGVKAGAEAQVLLGVTGSGKTFTVANVIQELNRPTLIMSHNKTLAAQLYSEMKAFFPHNAVEYFVSYYDYYQPEAYIPSTDTYIDKDLSINEEIDRLRLSAVAALLSGRKDVIIVSSVSCIYGLGSPQDFTANVVELKRGEVMPMDNLLKQLVGAQYVRNDIELARGRFRVKGDTIDIALAYADYLVRVEFFGNEIDAILTVDPISGQVIEEFDHYNLSPATIFLTSAERIASAKEQIKADLAKQIEYFIGIGEELYAKRIEERVKIMEDLRKGEYDVLVGVNLLREGLDLPEVSLVAILDADKTGFLRDQRSLTQTVGRAARHVHGKAVLYGDKITPAMQATIDETNRRRAIQMKYNEEHGIVPTPIKKEINTSALAGLYKDPEEEKRKLTESIKAGWKNAEWQKMDAKKLEKAIDEKRKQMLAAAKATDFETAAFLRDEMLEMQNRLQAIEG